MGSSAHPLQCDSELELQLPLLRTPLVAHRFAGKAGEAHRAFVLSADTFGREGDSPWQQWTDVPERKLEAVTRFMLGQASPFDVLLFFDGRNPNHREVYGEARQGRGRGSE